MGLSMELTEFNEKKTTQIVSRILKSLGGKMYYIHTIKLLYLIDRSALLDWGYTLTGDEYFAMEYGPNLSNTDNLVSEEIQEGQSEYWKKYIRSISNYSIELINATIEDGELSDAETELIDTIVNQYGKWDRWKLIHEVMHKLPEWRNPLEFNRSRIPIELHDILKRGGGKTEIEIAEIEKELSSNYIAEKLLGSKIAA